MPSSVIAAFPTCLYYTKFKRREQFAICTAFNDFFMLIDQSNFVKKIPKIAETIAFSAEIGYDKIKTQFINYLKEH